jgi:hypothetical protein
MLAFYVSNLSQLLDYAHQLPKEFFINIVVTSYPANGNWHAQHL